MKTLPWILAALVVGAVVLDYHRVNEGRDAYESSLQQTLIDLDAERQAAIEGMNKALVGQRAAEARLDSIVAGLLPVDMSMVRFEVRAVSGPDSISMGRSWGTDTFEVYQRGRRK